MRRLLLAAVVLAVTPGAAASSSNRPLLTYAVAPMYVRGGALSLGLCATDLNGNTFRLTDPHYNDRQSWSPDGHSVAFVGPADPPGQDHGIDLFVADAQGQNTRDLTSNAGRGGPSGAFGWSPDGSELGANWSGLGNAVFIAKTDGSGSRLLASTDYGAYVFGDSWSPDGRQILLSRSSFGNIPPTISVINADGTDERKLLTAADLASWSPDGRQIAYVAYIDGRGTGLGVARADGSDAHLLFQGAIQIWQPVWSPDGTRLAYLESSNGADGNLRVVRADGTDARVLTTGVSGTPQWSPDGSLIAFTHGPERSPVVAVIKPDGTQDRDVAAGSDPVWRTGAALPSDRRPCIVYGTSRADVIHGTSRGDVILAGRGNDVVYGGGGDDAIVGGLGQDRLYGGTGNDRFNARDRLRDYVFGGPGTDRAYHDPVDRLFSIKY